MTEEKIDVEEPIPTHTKDICNLLSENALFFSKLLRIFHKNALKCNGCASKKFLQVFIALISNKVLLKSTKRMHQWTKE